MVVAKPQSSLGNSNLGPIHMPCSQTEGEGTPTEVREEGGVYQVFRLLI